MYTIETVTHREATLLVDGEIICGSIFGDAFVAGSWRRDEFRPERVHPLHGYRISEPFTFDISGREVDEVVGSMTQYVVRATRKEVIG